MVIKTMVTSLTCQKRKFKALKNNFTTVNMLLFFFFDLQLTGLIQNEQNTAKSKHFTKPAEYIRTTSGTFFQRGCIDKRRSGDFAVYL